MRFAHCSDWHLYDKHKYSSGGKRLEEIMANCTDIIEGAANFEVDRLIIAGDIFHHFNPSERLLTHFAVLMSRAISLGVKVRIIIGQHDTSGIDWSLQSLTTHLGTMYQKMGINLNDEYLQIYPSGEVFFEQVGGVNFFYVSWTPNAEELIKNIKIDEVQSNVLVAHVGILGVKTPSGFMMDKGYMDPAVLKDFDYVAMGDFHNSQTIGENIHYAGAPVRFRWDERDNDLGYNLVEISEKVTVHRIPLVDIEMIQTTMAATDINDDLPIEIGGKAVKGAVLKIDVTGKLTDSKRIQLKAGLYEAGARQVHIKTERQSETLKDGGVEIAGLSIIDMIKRQKLDESIEKYGVEIATQI